MNLWIKLRVLMLVLPASIMSIYSDVLVGDSKLQNKWHLGRHTGNVKYLAARLSK